MANENSICVPALMELMNATHAIGSPPAHTAATKDSLKAALYYASASITRATTIYTTTGECTGGGYTAAGIAVPNTVVPTYSGDVAYWTPSGALVYSGLTQAAFDAVLIYNSTQGNKAISVHNFGSQTVTAGTFTLTMPVNADSTALIRFSRV